METQHAAKLGIKSCVTNFIFIRSFHDSDKLQIEKFKESTIEQRKIVVKMQFYSHYGM